MRTVLVLGALALSVMPVFFMVLLQRLRSQQLHPDKVSFTYPVKHVESDFITVGKALEKSTARRALAEAQLIAQSQEAVALLSTAGTPGNGAVVSSDWLAGLCAQNGLVAARILPVGTTVPVASFGQMPKTMNGIAMAKVRKSLESMLVRFWWQADQQVERSRRAKGYS